MICQKRQWTHQRRTTHKSKHENERARATNTTILTIERSTTWNRNWAGFSNDNQAKLHKIPSNWSAIHRTSVCACVFVAMVLNKDLHTEQRVRKKSFNTLHKYRSIVCNWTYENSFRFANAHTHRALTLCSLYCLIADIPEFLNLFCCVFFLSVWIYMIFFLIVIIVVVVNTHL